MSQDTAVYDLGEVSGRATEPQPMFSAPAAAEAQAPAWRPPPRAARIPAPSSLDWTGSLSLFVPGSAQVVRGQFGVGLCLLSCMMFLSVLFWAVLDSLDRLIGTLGLLGYPKEFAVWALAALFGMACLLHLLGVLTRTADDGESGRRLAPHPAVPGIASLLVPGWGQILNGDRKRAALFLSGVWAVAAAWILASPAAQGLLQNHGFYLPKAIELFASSAVRWTLPAVIWTLAVYDATSSAAGRR